ncbi:hypothetical protein G6O67_000569 [Ophiocordyceps sinensis]|uniref:Uncharacterized protein n=1 Tax=Ophiocordyceps sinensis TaxID=72228 RepID=A0A8H4PZC8_9HYPO|nr:hypothetical protein G6O67_000569 [Ophiocordyceps sinensis]
MDVADFSSPSPPLSATAPGWHALHHDAAAAPLPSPFLSESAHVLSLQKPPGDAAVPFQPPDDVAVPPPSVSERLPGGGLVAEAPSQQTVARVPSVAAASTAAVSSSTASSWHMPGRRWLSKARRDVDSKLRPRSHKEVRRTRPAPRG